MKQKFIPGLFLLTFLTNFIFSDPPEPVTDLRVVEVHFKQVKLSWTVPVSTEPVACYQIRVSTFLILSTEDEWNNNSSNTTYPYRVLISTSGVPSGTLVNYTITGLTNGVGYYFAIKSSTFNAELDDQNSWSQIQSSFPYTYRYALPQNSQPQQFRPIWPVASVVVTSQTAIPFDWEDANDIDVLYSDSLRYELYWSTNSGLLNTTSPDLTSANVIFNLTTSYCEISTNYFLDNTTYYWRVKVIDSENAYNWSYGTLIGKESVFIINHTPEPPSSFTLLSPVYASTVTTPVTFYWTQPSDPDPQDVIKYSLYISSQGQNIGFALAVGDITGSSYTLNSVFGGFVENTTYWWYIVAKDTFGLESYSSTWWFIINKLEESPTQNFLISPGVTTYFNLDPYNNNHIVFTFHPTFYWTLSSDPDCYNIVFYQILISSYSDVPDESNSTFYTTTPIYTTYYCLTDIALQDDTTYFWRVRIWDEPYSGYAVYSSTVYWFYTCSMLNSAELISPEDNFTTSYLLPTFEWQPNFVGYEINFASQTLVYWTGNTTTTISGLSPYTTSYTLSEPLTNDNTYYWQIIAHSNSPSIPLVSSSTVIFKFYVHNSSPSVFDLVSPSGCVITSSYVTLTWTTSSDDDPYSYTVVYSTDNFLTSISSSGIYTTELVLDNLQDNTTYHWYVKSVDRWGHTTLSNQTFYFVVNNILQPPATFNLLSPGNNSLLTNTYTTFYWESSYDPDPFESVVYTIYVSTDPEFTYVSFSTTVIDTQFFLPKGYLQVNSTYYWIVIASSTDSGFTVCNSTFMFKIINTAPVGLSIISPQNYTLVTSSPVIINWNPAYDPQGDEFHYELYYTTYVGEGNVWLSTNCIILSSTEYSYTLQDVVDDTTYYWYIVTVDTYNNLISLGPFIFWTSYDNQPPTVPSFIQPSNNEVVWLPYSIKWSTSTDYDLFDEVKYTLEISTTAEFTTVLTITSSIKTTEFKLSNFELIPSTYFLRVVALDKYNGMSISTVSFYIQQYYISISSPQNGEIIKSLPIKFYFSKVVPKYSGDEISYKLVYSSITNFGYKLELSLQDNFYEITTPPVYPSTYYWYVEVYYNRNYAGRSDNFSFIIPDITPEAPGNLRVSTQPYGVVLSWDKVDIENLWGYRVYSGYDITSFVLVTFTTSTNYIDIHGIGKNLFYTVSSVNQFGKESGNDKYVRIYYGEMAEVYVSSDGKLIFTLSPKEKLKNVKIERLSQEETDKYFYVYKISADKTKLQNFAEIRIINSGSVNSGCIVEYFDGYNWVFFPSEEVGNGIVIKTQYLGKYRVSKTEQGYPDELTIIGCSPKKRIITPNSDGKNDYIEFHYKPNSYIEGEIFDINLQRICKLKRKKENVLYFDGINDEGKLLPPGIYIYNIKAEQKTFTGTIVIKY